MGRRLSSAAIIVGALLLDPIAGAQNWTSDPEHVRLERLSAPSVRADRVLPTLESPTKDENDYDIPLSGGRKHLIVLGTLNGTVTGPMLVDTGASYCVLTRKTMRKLGLPRKSRRTIPVVTANGQVDAELVEIDAVQLRRTRLARVDAVVMDAVEPPLIGIIGLNFLTQFRFSVDLAQGTLRLEP
jgi:clan AA aspartic protease (TIGR02281 family)